MPEKSERVPTNKHSNKIATTNGHWVKTTMDGLGRTIKTETGNGSTTVSTVDTVYVSADVRRSARLDSSRNLTISMEPFIGPHIITTGWARSPGHAGVAVPSSRSAEFGRE